MQQVVHCGFRVNELSRFEQCFFWRAGCSKRFKCLLYSVFICMQPHRLSEQISCEIFIDCSLLDCQFIVLALSLISISNKC